MDWLQKKKILLIQSAARFPDEPVSGSRFFALKWERKKKLFEKNRDKWLRTW